MPDVEPWIACIRLSDSFADAIATLLRELDSRMLEWSTDGAPADRTVATLLLAGGAELAAIERLGGLEGSGPRFVVGAATDHRLVASALQAGATDYFALPDDLDLLRRSLERLIRGARGRTNAARYADEERRTNGFAAMVGDSPALRRALDQARRVAAHGDVTVLISGETGTGKELLARAVHYEGPRSSEPFVEVNCAAIPGNLLESELFGHERGAFTGAVAPKPGLFELAHGGTLLLDEVGHLPLELQAKLLRALESKEIRRVGGSASRRVDARVIAATHVDLANAVVRGDFREDLFYRLNVIGLTLPPLRERAGDVELLASTFLARLASAYGLPVPPLSPELVQALRAHPWPGNVRELRNAIERALVLSPPGVLRPEELQLTRPSSSRGNRGELPFPADLATITRAAVRATLDQVQGNKSEAARQLGISRPRLQRILEQTDD